jgi:hypothetical protein
VSHSETSIRQHFGGFPSAAKNSVQPSCNQMRPKIGLGEWDRRDRSAAGAETGRAELDRVGSRDGESDPRPRVPAVGVCSETTRRPRSQKWKHWLGDLYMSMSFRKFAGWCCLCGFCAACTVSIAGGSKHPPAYVVAPITTALTAGTTGATISSSGGQVTITVVADEVNGRSYSAIFGDAQVVADHANPAFRSLADLIA